MRKFFKRAVTFSLAGFLSFASLGANYVSASSVTKMSTVVQQTPDFDNMSIEELDNYITKLRKECMIKNRKGVKGSSSYYVTDPMASYKNAWLAAAAIANQKGYTCAATLVTCSVNGYDYYETNGKFSAKIKQTSVYSNWKRTLSPSYIAFEKYDNSDLFYALHNVNIGVASSSSQGARIHVSDVFDFKLDKDYESIFTSSVNNWAFLCQACGVLKVIDVDIYFNA